MSLYFPGVLAGAREHVLGLVRTAGHVVHPAPISADDRERLMARSQACIYVVAGDTPTDLIDTLEVGWFTGQGRPVMVVELTRFLVTQTVGRFVELTGFVVRSPQEVLDRLGELERLTDPRCHKCGCTEYEPCEGGCSWRHQDPWLCSRCPEDET